MSPFHTIPNILNPAILMGPQTFKQESLLFIFSQFFNISNNHGPWQKSWSCNFFQFILPYTPGFFKVLRPKKLNGSNFKVFEVPFPIIFCLYKCDMKFLMTLMDFDLIRYIEVMTINNKYVHVIGWGTPGPNVARAPFKSNWNRSYKK